MSGNVKLRSNKNVAFIQFWNNYSFLFVLKGVSKIE